MKFLIILLMPLISFAQFRLEITNSEGQQMSHECSTTEDCNSHISKFKNRWGRDAGWLRTDCGNSLGTRTVNDPVEGDVTEYDCPATYTANIVDISAELADKAIDAAINQNVDCGISTIKYISKRNLLKGISETDVENVLQTYSTINSMLTTGSLTTAISKITAEPVTALITQEDKDAIIAKINSCKAN